jgi:Mg-chelatase subunit ChlD
MTKDNQHDLDAGALQLHFRKQRSDLISWLVKNNLFSTLGVLKQCSFDYDPSCPTAMVAVPASGIPMIRIGTKGTLLSQAAFRALAIHEIRHLFQSIGESPSQRELRDLANIVQDAALHEDLQKLEPVGFKELDATFGAWTVNWLQTVLDDAKQEQKDEIISLGLMDSTVLQKERDWVYYYKVFLKLYEQEQKEKKDQECKGGAQGKGADGVEGEGPQGQQGKASVQKKISDYLSQGSLDVHDFDNLPEDVKNALREKIQKGLLDGERMAAAAGRMAADRPLDYAKGIQLDLMTKKVLNSIRSKASFLARKKFSVDYSHKKVNRLDEEMPGELLVNKRKPMVIALIDTSGSMAQSIILGKCVSAVRELYKQNRLAGAFSFDTELYDLTVSSSGYVESLRGGGGTVISDEYLTRIVSRMRAAQKGQIDGTKTVIKSQSRRTSFNDLDFPFEVVLLTDGAIHWDISDKYKKKFHQIIIG